MYPQFIVLSKNYPNCFYVSANKPISRRYSTSPSQFGSYCSSISILTSPYMKQGSTRWILTRATSLLNTCIKNTRWSSSYLLIRWSLRPISTTHLSLSTLCLVLQQKEGERRVGYSVKGSYISADGECVVGLSIYPLSFLKKATNYKLSIQIIHCFLNSKRINSANSISKLESRTAGMEEEKIIILLTSKSCPFAKDMKQAYSCYLAMNTFKDFENGE